MGVEYKSDEIAIIIIVLFAFVISEVVVKDLS